MELLQQLTETRLGLYVLLGGFGVVTTWESLRPRRAASASTRRRWINNYLCLVVNGLLLRWAMPASAVAWSAMAADRGWGLLPGAGLPAWAGLALGLLALDLQG